MSHVVIAYLAHTMANVLGMTDEERTAILNKFLTSETILNDSRICMLSFLEEEQIQLNRAEMFRPLPSNNGTIICNITALDLSPFVVDVAGILLPKPNLLDASSSQPKQKLVWTETTRRNLNRIAVSVSIGAPVLVTGAAGVGKTSLVEEVARMVGQKDLLKIHLGDQTDSKILLGTYVCQNEPGSFRWQPGILTTAVMQGRWVLIEDLDLAPLEVVSVLIPLLETGHLFIPARGEKVRARQGFQLFATQTVSSNASKFGISSRGGSGGSGEMGAALWNRIAVDALPTTEMVQVVSALFPNLGAVFSPLIVKTFEGLVTMFRSALGVNRVVSFRDVIKWCYRLDRLHASVFVEDAMKMGENVEGSIESVSLQARECLFREAVECFTMMLMDRKIRDRAMSIVADILVIPPTRLEFYSDHYLPVLSVAEKGSSKKGINTVAKVTVGRTSLSFTKTPAKTFETASTFANTTLSLRLLEKLAVCVSMQESVLLTGETGTGKTTIIQQLASMCGKSLTVINMSQQSDSTDLLGGFKPVEATMIAMPMLERFEALFSRTFSATANAAFLESVRSAFIKKKWDVLKLGFGNSVRMADKVLGLQKSQDGEPQAKKSKKLQSDPSLVADWEEFSTMVKSFSAQLDHLKNSFLFSFVEGTLVKAITRGDWILLDEVNLASAETLESLSGILQSSTGSILLLERGDTEPVKRHPDFRLFACMNPANDAGKRDLPPGLLSRFTEMWVDSPDTVPQDLALIINRHLHSCLPPPTQGGNAMVSYISEFHTSVKAAAESGFLVDGSGHKVCINLRTLTRALGFASACTPKYGLQRSVYEGCQMTYATILGKDSLEVIRKLFEKHLLNGIKNMGSFLKNIPKIPDSEENSHILFGAYWIRRGPLEVNDAPKYVLTPSVDMNLSRLARAVMSSKFPVLIQGPTSAGKTSMVEYLATRTGHRFIRVNNHEHTDLQEYIGTYVSNSEGKLVFREGVLVEALRKGHWIVLDELNLAPSDVLESLNRLLDDNRELLIPETQEVVRPHPGFMLFATQNPPGLYGGRKQLSRAFRSRFIELHFDDIPEPELSIILEKRCRLPPSYSAKIVATYKGLQNARQRSRIFEGKHAFATLRDLFRWGNRPAENAQELAEHGFMVLAEKSRRDDEKDVVRDVLEQTFRLKIDPTALYDREWRLFMGNVTANSDFVKDIVWTNAMKRLFVLVLKCITNMEPIFETGCGKTTVCQILTTLMGVNLQIVNAHAGSETSDFIGSMRPVRGRDRTVAETLEAITALWEKIAAHTEEESDFMSSTNINSLFTEYNGNLQVMIDLVKSRINQLDPQDSWNAQLQTIESLFIQSKKMFEWSDGPLVNAMRVGEAFLLDEISLADDSVLERLNSVLESERLLVLAERGAVNADGEDSNDPTHSHIEEIRGHQNFSFMATMNPGGDYGKKELSPALRNRKLGMVRTSIVSLRDIMAWVAFITSMVKQSDPTEASSILLLGKSIFHGGCMVLLDGIGVNPLFGSMLGSAAAATFRKDCSQRLAEDIYAQFLSQESITLDQFLIEVSFFVDKVHIVRENDMFGIPPFLVKCGPEARKDIKFALQAPTTSINTLRVLRALRLSKPVLLEGINLSEQTDLMDLFGSDLPVEGGKGGEFAWRDGPFLSAMKTGQWVLLDELNLATQQVLEGLNACLDHRASVYIPELNRSFDCHKDFRQQLDEFSMNSGIDAVELLGGFEQVDLNRREQSIVRLLEHSLDCVFRYVGTSQLMVEAEFVNRVFGLQTQLRDLCQSNNALSVEVTKAVLNRLEKIIEMFGESLETFLVKAGCKLPFEILEMCDQLQRLRESGVHGQFEWIDGTLIKALEEGRWILIDNANMCPASVLDRLNHLLEPNGVLIVNERGLVNGQIKVIHPHPNFRMFMTMDPHLGEISRAMRNRGVELFIRPPENDDASTLFARLTVERLERGVSWANAAKQSIMDVYVDLSAIESLPEDVASPLLEAVSDVINYTPHQTSQNVDIATGSWPVRVSGRFVVEESILSRASLEASLILKLSTAESQVDLNVTSNISTELQDTLITPMPKVASLLRSSCMQFVQQSLVPVSSELKSKFLQHILQKYATHISTEQLQIAIKLLESEKYMEPLQQDAVAHPLMLIDSKIKHSILEAVSTLYYLDESSSSETSDMQKMICLLPTEIAAQFDELELKAATIAKFFEVDVPLQESFVSLESLGSRGVAFGLMPITEIKSLRSQALILMRLTELVLNSVSMAQKKTFVLGLVSEIRDLIKYEIEETLNMSQNLQPLQRIVWMLNSDWIDNVSDEQFIPQIKDVLFEAAYRGSMRDVPIYGFKSKVNQIQKLAKVLNEPLVPDYVYESLKGDIHMVFLLLDQIITGHEHYFVADTFNTLVASVSKLRSTLLTDPVAVSSNIQGILGLLKSIPEKQLKYLNSVFEMFSVISVSGLSVSSVGKIWVSISMAFLRSYLPSTPIDPALSAQTQLDILSSISERIKSDILVRLELDFVSQSDSQAAAHDTQLDSLRDIHISQRKIRSRMVYRPEQSQIGAIVNDLSHLGNNVLRDEIIALSLTDDVKQKTFLQESLQAFIQRMETKYPLYRDILQPVFLSVYQLRLGLSSLAADQDDYYEISVEVNRLMGSLLEFTGFLKSEDLTGHSFSAALKDISRISSKENEISTLISVIRRFCWGIEYQQHISRTDLEIIHDWFNELSEKWVETEALVSQHEREKDELYKFKERTHEVLTEAEIEEKDLLEIFPDFYDEFEGEVQNDDDPHIKKLPPLVSATPTEPPKAPVRLDDSIAFEVREMHEHMFRATSSTLTHEQLRQSYQKVYMSTFEASAKVFDTTINPLDFKYEVTSRAGKIVVAQMRLDALTALDEEVKVSDNFDFYRDHNIAEAQRLQSMLKTLDEMVGRLLDEWPENSTLLHIRVMNNRLASFSITSPIMKLLTGVELLFQKCHEWETYASSAVSLKSHLEQMTNLIVRWRKLELQSWKNLLKNEDRLADTKSSKLWFHLFRSLIGPALTYANDDTRGEAAEADLVSIIDQLILSSSIGEFQGRLNLIISFHKHLAAIRKEARFTKSIDVMMNILWNIHRYYSQFSDYIKSHVEAQRKPIVKELDGYVRIATWKDVNVYALKESSKKSHYHLHKFVKKYREILSLPVKDVIVSHAQEVVLESGVVSSSKKKTVAHSLYSPSESSLISGSEVISNSVSQKDCAKYLARMRNLSRALISDTHNSETQEGVEDLVTTIIDRIQFFQTPPEEGAVVKGQRMIRKKALVDLLKYLEYLGLSPNTSVRHSNNQNPTYLYSRAKLDMTNSLVDSLRLEGMDTSMNATSSTLYKQSDNYFFKILTRMGSVRTSAITYNKDLSDREMSKSVSFLEDLLHMIIDERNILSAAVASISAPAIESARRCYVQLQGADKGRFSPLKADYSVTESVIESHKRALDETDAFITQALIVMDCIGKATSLPQEAMTSVRAVQTSMARSRSEVNRIFSTYCARAAGSMVPFLVTTEIQTALAAASECLSQTLSDIQTIALTYPSISWLFENICSRVSLAIHSLSDSKLAIHEEKVSSDVADIASKCDSLVDSILVAFQDLRPKESTADAKNPNDPTTLENTPEIDEFGLEKGNIRNSHSTFCKTFQTDNPRLSNLLVSIESILHDITLVSESNLEACSRLLGHVYPLLQQYLLMYQFKIYEFIGFHKSICKLTYVLSNSFAILFKKGFCIPKEEDDQEDNNQEEEAGTGMGIGEGEGEKDVSNEIEDESQVEGLKNDSKEAPKPEKKMKEEKDGVEMEGDFDGVLEDVSDDGENDDEDDDKDEKELDEEQMGDLDRDLADVVDEKLWDGDEEKQDQDAKTERDSKAESKPGETDLVAKEEDSKGPKEPPQPQDKKDAKEDESKDEEGDDGEDGDEDELDKMPEDDHINDMENQYEDNNGVKPTSSIEDDESQEKGDEEDNMDLPEDLNLDDEKDGGGKEDEGFDDMNLDKDDRPDSPINEDQDVDDMEEEQFPTEEADAQMDRLDENAEDEEMAEQEDVEPTAGDDPVPEQTPKENQEVLNTEPDEEKEGEEEEDKPQTNARDKNLGNADTQTTKDKVVNAAAENDNDQKDNSNDANATADSGQDSQKKDGGRNDVANERESQDQNESEHQKNQDSDFNPHRSLGDATKKWINRFKNLFDKDTTQEEKPQPDAVQKDENEMEDGENQDFEFVENDESSFDAQVLHAANTEQMNQMDQKALAEEKKDDDLMDVDEEEAVEDQEEDETKNEAPNNSEKNEDDGKTENQGKVKNGPKLGQLSDKDENPGDKDDEAAEEEGDSKDTDAKMDDELDDDKKHVHDPSNEDAEDELELEPLDEAALQELRQQLQESTEEWRKTGRDLTEARTLWRAYSSLTRELSFALCESLRLILEPTLATKLKGDYRAGKRLNMRKVIAYIASQFKKDKIWLRRTRPSKRTYQIMISIDDSKSMAESKSIELAFESLSLISKALTQLEVGEISVVSFGEDVRLLHPFDRPFSDEAGAEVIHDFTFNQDGTHVRKMMETTTDILKTARQSSQGSAELWQLQIIISDGILEDHAAVRALVRQAANARIMVVFVILDKRGDRDSILRMTNVTYTSAGLQMSRYMDTFPFDFYVVLNRIEDLPEVLSDVLRQYFLFVSL
ncbi:hypothetical protein HDU99_010346 [Rhizoclosmatium hyalinum]|nr:hypothetical protein HDU99_010346 [Rhizoclosmatium hyalinum]